MSSAHRLLVELNNLSDASADTTTAVATKWLLDVVPDLDVIHEAKSAWGSERVQFIVTLTDEQVQAVKDADGITHLKEEE